MAIDSALEQIKERTPIFDLVAQRVKLIKTGRNFKGLCPFHNEKTPSFYVFPDRDNWHCFGCGLGGDAFGFVMRTENVEFPEALRILAARTGVELTSRTSRKAQADRHRRQYDINGAAASYFQAMLYAADGAAALEYALGRGLTRDTLEQFQVGWAPDSWDSLLRRLGDQGYSADELAALGLVVARETEGHYDRFRGRLMFPIRDADGNVIGFGGRSLGDSQPKYLNSSDTPVFSKSNSLYAIDRARAEIKRAGLAVVVEGYMDAIAAHQAGITNVVAALGTALTEQHLLTLKRLAPRAVLALDADAAGSAAALRTLEVLRGTFGRMAVPIADRRGLVRLRRDQELDVRVARLPAGKDPDDVVRESPELMRDLIAGARPILEVLIDAELVAAGDDFAARARAADTVLDFLKDLPNPVLADQYTRLLAERQGVDYEALRSRLAQLRRTQRPARPAAPPAAVREEPEPEGLRDWLTLEEYLLRLVLLHPDRAAAIVADLDGEDFYRADARAVFDAVRLALGRGPLRAEELVEDLDDALAEYAAWILEWGSDLPDDESPAIDRELVACSLRLRLLNHHREIALIGTFRRDLDRDADMTHWPRQSARVAELVGHIRELERTPGGKYTPPWMAVIRGEENIGPMRTVARTRRVEEPSTEQQVPVAV